MRILNDIVVILYAISLFQTVKCLLIVPNPASALNEEAGKLLLEHYDDYSRQAKMMTEIHALRQRNNQDATLKQSKLKDLPQPSSESNLPKKRPAEDAKKKKVDKKRALKRL